MFSKLDNVQLLALILVPMWIFLLSHGWLH
jgi:hypothetical protein